MSESKYKCLSINIAGLRNYIKRKHLEKILRRERTSIICLQETYIQKRGLRWLKQIFQGNIYHAPGTNKTCGVMIRVAWNCPWCLCKKHR